MKATFKFSISQETMQRICWVLVLGAISFYFLFMLYGDNLINSVVGYRYLDSVLTGHLAEFYNAMDWSYGISIYTIYAVWSLPVWIFFRITGLEVNVETIPVLLWYKLLLVIFAVWSVYLIGKIARYVYEGKEKEMQLQYACSFLFVFPVFAIAQCDIIGLCFVLLGVYYYLQEKEAKFLLFFTIAATMKYFALLAFIPLILFRYRKISRLIKVFMAGMLLVIVSMVIMLQSSTASAMMQDENYYVNKQIEFFATIRLDLGDTRFLGLMGLFYGILCVIAYTIPNNDKEKNKKYALWLALGGYMCFFLFYPCNFYWYVLLAPFLILVAYNHRENLKINLILIMLHELMTAICFIYLSPWVLFGPQSFSYLFLKDYAIEENAFQYFVNTALHADLGPYMAIFRGIAYACAGCFMWINFPRRLAKEQGVEGSEEQKELEGEIQAITWMRILVLYVWIFICVYSLISFNRG